MNILVINSGSSSIKFQMFQMPEQKVICSGLMERIGQHNAKVSYKTNSQDYEKVGEIKDHRQGLSIISELLLHESHGVIQDREDLDAIGHRVVHGGSVFSNTVEITQEVKNQIQELIGLAPLHNPANLEGIQVAEEVFPKAKQIAVFDTAYHQTIPEYAYRYAIDKKLADEHKIRVYGFHGTSHKYIAKQVSAFLGPDKSQRIISVHLGNGCSITAIKDGKSIDHSLGMGPVNGLVMGTRSGDIDQSVIFYLMDKMGYSSREANDFLQKKSGMLGLTGYSDLRDIEDTASKGNCDCQMALEINTYRIKKFIGSYVAALGGIDALVFTAGIGENSDVVRGLVCQGMECFGLELDSDKNAIRSKETRIISTESSKVPIVVCPTNEELEIASQSYELIK